MSCVPSPLPTSSENVIADLAVLTDSLSRTEPRAAASRNAVCRSCIGVSAVAATAGADCPPRLTARSAPTATQRTNASPTKTVRRGRPSRRTTGSPAVGPTAVPHSPNGLGSSPMRRLSGFLPNRLKRHRRASTIRTVLSRSQQRPAPEPPSSAIRVSSEASVAWREARHSRLRHAFDHACQVRAGVAVAACELHQLGDAVKQRAALWRPDDADAVPLA